MKNILARANRNVLKRFAKSNVLLAFDFDGTLAPIVATPSRAAMRATTRALLGRVSAVYPCVVISGRARRDVTARLRGTGISTVIGNHGVEPWQATAPVRRAVGGWRTALDRRLGRIQGVEIEDKGYSLAIHYRRARNKRAARLAIARAVGELAGVRVVGGVMVVNVIPGGAPHKGVALERERRRRRCDNAIYVGDDETDEDVFTMGSDGRLLAVRVGARRRSAAGYCVRDQRQVDDLLRALLALRSQPDEEER